MKGRLMLTPTQFGDVYRLESEATPPRGPERNKGLCVRMYEAAKLGPEKVSQKRTASLAWLPARTPGMGTLFSVAVIPFGKAPGVLPVRKVSVVIKLKPLKSKAEAGPAQNSMA